MRPETDKTCVYIAARYGRKEEMGVVAQKLRDTGRFLILSTWHDGADDHMVTEEDHQEIAMKDFREVRDADLIVSYTEPPGEFYKYGSRHVEFGLAYGNGAHCVLIGPRELMFHRLPGVLQFKTLDEFLAAPLKFSHKDTSAATWVINEPRLEFVGTSPVRVKVGGLPIDAKERKNTPICTGFLDYFPLAAAEVARVSKKGNDQHNPGEPLHWARDKSKDHADSLIRHQLERGKIDSDGERHSAKVAWRAMAQLELELEAANDPFSFP